MSSWWPPPTTMSWWLTYWCPLRLLYRRDQTQIGRQQILTKLDALSDTERKEIYTSMHKYTFIFAYTKIEEKDIYLILTPSTISSWKLSLWWLFSGSLNDTHTRTHRTWKDLPNIARGPSPISSSRLHLPSSFLVTVLTLSGIIDFLFPTATMSWPADVALPHCLTVIALWSICGGRLIRIITEWKEHEIWSQDIGIWAPDPPTVFSESFNSLSLSFFFHIMETKTPRLLTEIKCDVMPAKELHIKCDRGMTLSVPHHELSSSMSAGAMLLVSCLFPCSAHPRAGHIKARVMNL